MSAKIQFRIKFLPKDALRRVFNFLSYSSAISGKMQGCLNTLSKHFCLLINHCDLGKTLLML